MLGVALAVVRSKYWDEHDRRAHSLSFSEFVAAPVFLLAELVMAADLRVGPYWLGSRWSFAAVSVDRSQLTVFLVVVGSISGFLEMLKLR